MTTGAVAQDPFERRAIRSVPPSGRVIDIESVVDRVLASRWGLVWCAVPAYAGLLAITARHSLVPLLSGDVPPDLGYGRATIVSLQLLHIACLAYLFAVYGLMLSRRRWQQHSTRDLAWSVVAVALMAWTLLPADSSDLLDYLGFGRIVSVYHASPYDHTYSEFSDRFSGFLTWDEPMPYGPLVLPIFAVMGWLSQHGVFLALYATKFLWLLVHLTNTWLVYRIAGPLAIDARRALLLYGCNPLLLFEQVGNGHNDGLLVCFCLIALLALQRGRERLALCCAFLATLVKTPGLLWLAGVAVIVVRSRHWRGLFQVLALALVALGLMFWLIPGSWAALTLQNEQWQDSEDSLHTIVIDGVRWLSAQIGDRWDYDDVFLVDRGVSSLLFASIALWLYTRISDVSSLVRELGRLLLVLLLGYAVSVYPWYLSWVVPLAALTDSVALRRGALSACAALLTLYGFPYRLVEQVPHHARWSALRLALAFGIPLSIWLWHEVEERRRQFQF